MEVKFDHQTVTPDVSTSGGFNSITKTKDVAPISKPYKNPPNIGGISTRNKPKRFISIVVLPFVVILVGVGGGDKESDTVSSVRIDDAVPAGISIINVSKDSCGKAQNLRYFAVR